MVVNPADVPSTQKEQLQKTGRVDSRKIAHSLRSGELTGIHSLYRVLWRHARYYVATVPL